jgi:hypothetical protein
VLIKEPAISSAQTQLIVTNPFSNHVQTPIKLPGKTKQIIGLTELIDLPDMGLAGVPAKVDTGAYTSALHCERVRLIQVGNATRLSFWVTDGSKGPSREIQTDHFSERTVRNSFGDAQKRYVITTYVVLFGRRIRVEFTLANRKRLKTPILLGRQLVRNRFVVDVAQRNLSHRLQGSA